MKDQKTIDLFLYWNRLRDGRPAPRRNEIEPADIRSLLGDTFILEEDARGQAVFRLAGTRLCALFGKELKGFVFSSLWSDRDRRIVNRLAGNAFRDNCVVALSLEGHSRAGRMIAMELVLLPIQGNGDGARALGSAVVLDKPFASSPPTPRRSSPPTCARGWSLTWSPRCLTISSSRVT